MQTISTRLLAAAALLGLQRPTPAPIPVQTLPAAPAPKTREEVIAIQKRRYARRVRFPDLGNTVGL